VAVFKAQNISKVIEPKTSLAFVLTVIFPSCTKIVSSLLTKVFAPSLMVWWIIMGSCISELIVCSYN